MDSHPSPPSSAPPTFPSLLWPPGHSSPAAPLLTPESALDLDLAPLVRELSGGDNHRAAFANRILGYLCSDADVITYRHEVLANLLDEPELYVRLLTLLPRLETLVRERQRPLFGYQWQLAEVAQRLGEIDVYVEVVQALDEILAEERLHAPAFQVLAKAVHVLAHSDEFVALQTELPELRRRLESVQSVTIGVNLGPDLAPQSATVLSLDTERIEGRGGLLERLLGKENARQGITPLRSPSTSLRSFFPPMRTTSQGYDNQLVEDLRHLLEAAIGPVGQAIERYVWVRSRDLATLEAELSFFLYGVAWIERLRAAGLPVCRPQVLPPGKRTTCLEGAYNPSLALRLLETGTDVAAAIVANDVTFDVDHGRVWILTGPNRGGKTTYVRTVGLAQILFSAGLYLPARRARISPIDALYTHFPSREGATPGEGRLDDEAERLASIFRQASPNSLILLNEVLSGTSTAEALGLAYDAVRGLRLLGVRAIYVTHLHDLARRVDEINLGTEGDALVGSLVAEAEEQMDLSQGHRRTFRVRTQQPSGQSFASEIAQQHGISYPQLQQLLRERGIVRG